MNCHRNQIWKQPAPSWGENMDGRLVLDLLDISRTMRSLYEGRGSQKRVLIVLSETGTITQRELTARLGIQPGSASEVIAKLESAGLVERTASEEDRRTANISLTEAGLRQAENALEQRKRRHEEMFSILSEEEKERLLALLEKINSDWDRRYQAVCEHHGHRHHDHQGHHHEHYEHFGHQGGERGCNHDCEHCEHPCGRGQGRQG
jgi:DNA-binding MarR family transcriptional regulator